MKPVFCALAIIFTLSMAHAVAAAGPFSPPPAPPSLDTLVEDVTKAASPGVREGGQCGGSSGCGTNMPCDDVQWTTYTCGKDYMCTRQDKWFWQCTGGGVATPIISARRQAEATLNATIAEVTALAADLPADSPAPAAASPAPKASPVVAAKAAVVNAAAAANPLQIPFYKDPVVALEETPELSTLAGLMANASLVDALKDPKAPATIFAPSNSAFDSLIQALGSNADKVLSDTDLLQTVLTYHVAPGASIGKARLLELAGAKGRNFTSLESEPFTVFSNGSDLTVASSDGITTAKVGQQLQGGVATLYVIDNVLVPAKVAAALSALASTPASSVPLSSPSAGAPAPAPAPKSGAAGLVASALALAAPALLAALL